jgi:hypothetical protein
MPPRQPYWPGYPPLRPPVPRIPRPVPRRLPQRKRMTIAVGLLLPSGELIVAADSQESYPNVKLDGRKIMALQVLSVSGYPEGCVVFTGAGSAGYLDSLGQKILGFFHDRRDLEGRALAEAFEAAIRRFYRRHVIPFGPDWAIAEGLNVSAIIAFQRGNTRGMVESVNNAIIIDKPIAAVGTGSTHALPLLDPISQQPITTEAALRLVAMSVFLAKERDQYCGKHTHLVLIRGNFSPRGR